MPGDVIQIGTAVTHVIAALVGAFIGVGVTAASAVIFVRSILNSPAVITLLEGIVESFPAETKELINLLGELLKVLSDGLPTTTVEFVDDDEVDG
jgi:hypothetical protein